MLASEDSFNPNNQKTLVILLH